MPLKILPFGTTTILADPHELANVSGEKGIRWLLEEIKRLPLNGYVMLPSCVPATELDDSGARLEAEDLLPLREDPSVLGLGEFMNVSGVAPERKKPLQSCGLFRIELSTAMRRDCWERICRRISSRGSAPIMSALSQRRLWSSCGAE